MVDYYDVDAMNAAAAAAAAAADTKAANEAAASYEFAMPDAVANTATNNNWVDNLLGLGVSAGINYFGADDPVIPKAGYQGSIPKYDFVREQVPNTFDPNRRPGSSGRRYFTDGSYAPQGTAPAAPTAGGLAALNASNAAIAAAGMAPAAGIAAPAAGIAAPAAGMAAAPAGIAAAMAPAAVAAANISSPFEATFPTSGKFLGEGPIKTDATYDERSGPNPIGGGSRYWDSYYNNPDFGSARLPDSELTSERVSDFYNLGYAGAPFEYEGKQLWSEDYPGATRLAVMPRTGYRYAYDETGGQVEVPIGLVSGFENEMGQVAPTKGDSVGTFNGKKVYLEGSGAYTTVQPQDGYRYLYTEDGERIEVPANHPVFSNRPEGSPKLKTKGGEYVGSGDEESSNTFEGIEYAAPTVAEEYDFNQYGRVAGVLGSALSAFSGIPGLGFALGEAGTAYGFDQAKDLAQGIMPDTPEYNALLEQLAYSPNLANLASMAIPSPFGTLAAKGLKAAGLGRADPADAYQSVMDQFSESIYADGIMGAMLEEGDRADIEEERPNGELYPDYRTLDRLGLLSDRDYDDLNVKGGMSNYGQTFDQLADPGARGRYNFTDRGVDGEPELTYDSLDDWVSSMSEQFFGPAQEELFAKTPSLPEVLGFGLGVDGEPELNYARGRRKGQPYNFTDRQELFDAVMATGMEKEAAMPGFAESGLADETQVPSAREAAAYSAAAQQAAAAQEEAAAEAEAEATADAVAEAEGVEGVDSTSGETSMDDEEDEEDDYGDDDDDDDDDDDEHAGGIIRANFAAGGIMPVAHNIARMKRGRYLGGATDGMADDIPATIDGKQKAALSDGEFVIPADVVSHLGNGNSDAGAKTLYAMMDRIRKVRTGSKKQGKEIRPKKFLPA